MSDEDPDRPIFEGQRVFKGDPDLMAWGYLLLALWLLATAIVVVVL